MTKSSIAVLLIVLSCAMCLGQSRFNNQIEPGLSTRADVDRALGQPLRAVNASLLEYPPPAGAARLAVKYRTGSNVVDVIQVDFPKSYSRAAILNSLKLPEQPDVTNVRDGHLQEYFGGTRFMVLVYAGADPNSGVSVLGYYSRELFQRVVADLPRQPATAAASPPSLMGRPSGTDLTASSDTEFRVKLLTPINTQTSKKGDKITAQVLEPQQFRGDVLEGSVRDAKSGGKIAGKSVLNFTFDTLNHGGKRWPVQANVKSIANSKGQQEMDEEGQVVRKKNNIGKIAAGTAIGALIGGLMAGGKGAAIGAGVGAAASLILVEVAVEGANVSFAPGSELVLSVRLSQASQP